MPPSRIAGIASNAPTTAAIAMQAAMPTNTDNPHRDASWPTVNAPMAANAPWASEISPAIPVNTVIDSDERIGELLAPLQRRLQDQHEEQHDERQGRPQALGEDAVGRQLARQD